MMKALLLAIAATGLFACGSDDQTATGNPDETVETLPSSTTTAVASDQNQLEVAVAFWEAVADGDRVTARSFIDPEADPSTTLFGRAATLEGQFDWYEITGFNWELEDCSEAGSVTVDCSVTASNRWSEALGVEPVTGTFSLWFGSDGILGIVDKGESFVSRWGPNVFSVFAEWVDENYPEDAQVMFTAEDVNPEVLRLYELNTARFVEAHEGG